MKPAMNRMVLIIAEEDSIRQECEPYLVENGFEINSSTTLQEASSIIDAGTSLAVLLVLHSPNPVAMEWVSRLKRNRPEVPIVILAGNSDVISAAEAMRNGADNFFVKPLDLPALGQFLAKCFESNLPETGFDSTQEAGKNVEPIFGKGESIAKVLKYIGLAAPNKSVVLLLGETGTGKGVIARWIHDNSGCRSAPFIELNCSGLKGELLKSDLFGHAKGAFTSAIKDREGLIEMADGGTLFLDEIGDMDLGAQAQLLKTIEDKTFRRVGETRLRKSNFRLICATNHDLAQESREGKFRLDLFYRINVFPIHVPPLRERSDDMQDLAYYFLKMFNYRQFPLAEPVLEFLKSYRWPGNVRELRNVMERACMFAQGQPLTINHFTDFQNDVPAQAAESEGDNLKRVEDLHILSTMRKFKGDKRKSCHALGMSFSNLYRRLSKIEEPELQQT